MEAIKEDVVIIGGGMAGLRAAIAAAEYNNKLSIAVVSKTLIRMKCQIYSRRWHIPHDNGLHQAYEISWSQDSYASGDYQDY